MLQKYPIDKSLPAEISTAASQLLQYQRRPVFSWSWWWRRLLYFGPIAVIFAISDGNSHGMFARDAMQGLLVAWHYAVEALVFVGGGTLLATGLRHLTTRHRVTRPGFEGLLLTAAVIAGFFLWDAADHWADNYHDRLMCGINGGECEPANKPIDSTLLGTVMQLSVPAGFYFLFGGGVALVSYGRERRGWAELQRRREREGLELRAQEADARLAILQAQVEPHFLFNTLASLRSLVRTEPERAEATIDALVTHLRATLPRIRESAVEPQSTLRQQLDICRSYLDVMRVRMGARLRYEINSPEALSDKPFPPLMLLLLVENAIKHGVEPDPGAHAVAIDAQALVLGGRHFLQVTVADDGAGLHEGLSAGVGLANVRAQLSLRYGADGVLDLRNAEARGAVATLRIPLESKRL